MLQTLSVSWLAFANDSLSLLTRGQDGTLRRWPLTREELLAGVRRLAGRNLTRDEWNRYFPEKPYHRTFADLPIHSTVVEQLVRIASTSGIGDALAGLEPDLRIEGRRATVDRLVSDAGTLAAKADHDGAMATMAIARKIDPGLDAGIDKTGGISSPAKRRSRGRSSDRAGWRACAPESRSRSRTICVGSCSPRTSRGWGVRLRRQVLDSGRVTGRTGFLTLFACLLLHSAATAGERWTIGLSTAGAPIEAEVVAGRAADSPTVLLVGGLQPPDQSSDAVAREVAAFERIPQARRAFRLVAIARANPDAQPLQLPPSGVAYREHIESHVLWRWLGAHAPDLVLVAGPDAGLVDALTQNIVIDVGRVPARRVEASTRLLASLQAPVFSSAHEELERRRARTPRALALELARVYGHDFAQPNYIAAMAIISRLRLGEDAEVEQLLGPYLAGDRDSFARPSQSSLASHLLFFEYARLTRDERAKALVLHAAASGFTENNEPREFMPLHGGWSDSLFMDVPILAAAGALTKERRYFDMAARHLAFMQRLVLRPDGLYRHQASAEAAWGRGNAFAALGLALTLSEFPKEHPDYPRLLASYQAHMAALARFQDENGMWRNVIDRPGAYPEYSATAMIGAAMLRGVRNGWIDRPAYEPRVQAAWNAVLTRTGADGRLIDVCESTGTRGLTDQDYLRRTAILGPDDRGGGMAMFFATELAGSQGVAGQRALGHDWYDEDEWHLQVRYLMTPSEAATYRAVKTEPERDDFIVQFWARRDPSPGTGRNESREEFDRRVAFANSRFTDPAVRRGEGEGSLGPSGHSRITAIRSTSTPSVY